MRKVTAATTVLVALIVLVLSLEAFAFKNEPDGFRGLKWGDPPKEEMEYLGDISEGNRDEANYKLRSDKMFIANAQFYEIVYLFHEGRFLSAILFFRGEKNYDLLEALCNERYGKAEFEEGLCTTFDWLGKKSFIMLSYNTVLEIGFLSLASTVMLLEKSEVRKKKEIEKTEGDW